MLDDANDKSVISRRTLLVLGTFASASEVLSRTRIARLWPSGEGADSGSQTDNNSACIYWNVRARQLVLDHQQDPVYASRTYALLSLAQGIAAHVASTSDIFIKNGKFASEIVNASVSSASIHFLSSSFPRAIDHDESIQKVICGLKSSGLNWENIKGVIEFGADSSRQVIRSRSADGADQEVAVSAPTGPGCWFPMEDLPPVRPYWGNVKTLCIDAILKYVPGPPPQIDRPEFKTALAEVRRISGQVTPHQEELIKYWADGIGTPTPSGHWNLIACNYLSKSKKSESQRAKILALLNIAMFDAGVVCWATKYKYWFARPSQIDPTISVRLKIPNFPSYFSGHSAFSAAASAVLGHFFKSESKAFKTMAKQASESRVHCGIHYKFDCEAGQRAGNQIGEYTVTSLNSSQSLVHLLQRSG